MASCTESHSGIQVDDDIIWSLVVWLPSRPNDDALSDSSDTIILAPLVRPFRIRYKPGHDFRRPRIEPRLLKAAMRSSK